MQLLTYFASGLLFAIGLILGGMTQPSKIIGFLDISGHWDASLAFVMLGAVGIHAVAYRVIIKRAHPLMAPKFLVPKRSDIDASLVVGACLFGVGWGLGGYCPGPALVSCGAVVPDAAIFLGATVAGHWLYGWYSQRGRRKAGQAKDQGISPTPVQAT